MAVAHTVWVLAKGVTSSNWDTVTELLALALRSSVSDKLRRSKAGIERLKTYNRLTRLRALREEGEERVMLVFDGEESHVKGGEGLEQGSEVRYKRVDGEYS